MTNETHTLITPKIFHDQPLDPAQLNGNAIFRFENYANTFARLIAATQTRTPLVIGVGGKSGSGKTTLLKLLRAKLDETEQLVKSGPKNISFVGADPNGDFRRCRTVWFNAWKYADQDALLIALTRAILDEMGYGSLQEKFGSQILTKSHPHYDVLSAFVDSFKIKFTGLGNGHNPSTHKTVTPFDTHAAFFDHFGEAFDQLLAMWVHDRLDVEKIDPQKGALVVFIDDLDRCLPAKTVQVLEAIKLFLDKPGVVFVLAADEAIIRSAVEAHYQNQKITGVGAQEYLEKIFQLHFTIPPLREPQAGDYMTRGLHLDEGLQNSVDQIIAGADNPRQIKNFVNYLNLGWALLVNSGQAEGVSREDFTSWLVLSRVAPEFCDKVRDLERGSRLKYITAAVDWAHGLERPDFAAENALLVDTFKQWENQHRLRRVLQKTTFSEQVNAEVLEGFIYWSAPPAEAEPATPAPERDDWIKIPAGEFVMGSVADDDEAYDSEKPKHTLNVTYDYLMARTTVTNDQFAQFVEETGYLTTAEESGAGHVYDGKEWQITPGADWQHPNGPQSSLDGMAEHPVVLVSWHDARAYCEWLTESVQDSDYSQREWTAHLPTEAEWEKAARGEPSYRWPWGDEWDANNCNAAMSVGTTTPVNHYSPVGDSPYGCANMAGNVWEWTSSRFEKYPYQKDDGREQGESRVRRVLRGGSFNGSSRIVRSAVRNVFNPDFRGGSVGFRVCVGTPPASATNS